MYNPFRPHVVRMNCTDANFDVFAIRKLGRVAVFPRWVFLKLDGNNNWTLPYDTHISGYTTGDVKSIRMTLQTKLTKFKPFTDKHYAEYLLRRGDSLPPRDSRLLPYTESREYWKNDPGFGVVGALHTQDVGAMNAKELLKHTRHYLTPDS